MGEGVDDPLQVVDGFGPARPPVGVGGHRVGDDAVHLPAHGHLVLAGCDPEPEQRDRHREVLGVGPHVGDGVQLVPEELAILGADQRGGADPAPAVDRRSRRLAPGLGPLHRVPELFGGPRHEDLVVVDVELAAEPAPNFGSDDPDVARPHPQRLRYRTGEGVRHLGRAVNGELAVSGVVLGEHRAGLDGNRDQTLVGHLHADHHCVVPLHRLVYLRCLVLETQSLPVAVIGPGVDDVGVELVVDLDLVGRGLLQVDDGGQDVEVDDDGFGGILSLVPILGHDHGDRLADMTHLSGGEQRAELADRHLGEERAEMGHVLVGVDGHDSGHALGRRRVELGDLPPGDRGAGEGDMQQPDGLEVVGVCPTTLDQRGILPTPDRATHDAGGCHQ